MATPNKWPRPPFGCPNGSSSIVVTCIKWPWSAWYTYFGFISRRWWRKIRSWMEVDDRLWTRHPQSPFIWFLLVRWSVRKRLMSPSALTQSSCGPVTLLLSCICFQMKCCHDKPLLRRQPPLTVHLLVPRGWPLNGISTVLLKVWFNSCALIQY